MFLAALPVLHLPLATGASAGAQAGCPAGRATPRQKLSLNVCGPANVVPGINYTYEVVLTNNGKVRHRKVTLSVIHADPITRSSVPYLRVYLPVYATDAAVWTLTRFKPGRTFRVTFTLPFRVHNDKKGSNFVVDARAYDPSARNGVTKDVLFK